MVVDAWFKLLSTLLFSKPVPVELIVSGMWSGCYNLAPVLQSTQLDALFDRFEPLDDAGTQTLDTYGETFFYTICKIFSI
jgi:hypothetical protein